MEGSIRTEADHDNSYSKALGSSPTAEEALTIKLNRVLTSLKTHQLEAALRDLETASPGSKSSEKAFFFFFFCKSQAIYYLQRFRESCEIHKVLGKELPKELGVGEGFSLSILLVLMKRRHGRRGTCYF